MTEILRTFREDKKVCAAMNFKGVGIGRSASTQMGMAVVVKPLSIQEVGMVMLCRRMGIDAARHQQTQHCREYRKIPGQTRYRLLSERVQKIPFSL
jgi:hypothetical protein